jgi:hypothetical protein
MRRRVVCLVKEYRPSRLADFFLYDPADKWVLLKLLDDNYLWSLMTDMAYEVTGKRDLAGDAG